ASATLILVEGNEEKKSEAKGSQRSDCLLFVFRDLLLLKKLDNLRFHEAGIVQWRKYKNPRKLSNKRAAAKIEAHNRNDKLPFFQRVAKFVLDIWTCSGRNNRQNAVRPINRALNGC